MDGNGEQASYEQSQGIGRVDIDTYTDISAYLCEQLEAGVIDLEEFANQLFGPEPNITYTHWSA